MGVLNVRIGQGAWIPITGIGTNPGISQDQADARYVNTTGDTMTGQLTVNNAGGMAIALVSDNGYIGFYDNAGTNRRGYLQGHAGGINLNADVGALTLGSASTRVQFPASLNVGVPANYGGFAGLNHNNGQYLIMTDGTNSFVSCPSASGILYLRGGANAGGISIDSGGVATGNGFNINGNNGFYFASWGGGWNMADASYVRSINDKHVWIGGGWYGTNGGVQIGYNGVNNAGYSLDNNGYTRSAQRIDAFGGLAIFNGTYLFLYNNSDTNHVMRYNGAIGGVELASWGKVRIFTPGGGWWYDHDADGYARTNGYGWVATSSIKIKENIEDISAERAENIVRDLRPVSFDRKDGTAFDQLGFIAEWTEPVAPWSVAPAIDETGPSMDYSKLVPPLTRVVQDLLERVKALETA